MKGGSPEDTLDAPSEEVVHFHPLPHTNAAEAVVLDYEEDREASSLLDDGEEDIEEDNSAVRKLEEEESAPGDNAADEEGKISAANRMAFPSIFLDEY